MVGCNDRRNITRVTQLPQPQVSRPDLCASLRRFNECGFDDRPWLILGKGPSYSKIDSIDLARFNVLAINHVVDTIERCEIAHMADWETFLASGEIAASKARFVCCPYVPYVGFKPSPKPLPQLAGDSPLLKRLIEVGRVLTYNLVSTSVSGRLEGFADVHLTNFSSEAVIDFLGHCGVSRVVSLGVDGGTHYSSAFANLVDKTLLASGQSTYDVQFDGIANALLRTGVSYRPLDIRGPIRARIHHGIDESLAADVLAYSIQRHSPLTVEIVTDSHARRNRVVPAVHQGFHVSPRGSKVLEFDARSLVVANLMPLYRRYFSESVALPLALDFAPDRGDRHGRSRHRWFDRFANQAIAMFDHSGALPWRSTAAPHHAAWMKSLREAIYWKRVSIRKVRAEIARGNVSPGIFESMSREPGDAHA